MPENESSPAQKSGKKFKAGTLLRILVILISAYLGLGFFVLPQVLRFGGQKALSQALGREVKLEKARFNPLSFSLSLYGINVKDSQGGDLLTVKRVNVDYEPWELVHAKLAVREIVLEEPKINVFFDENGHLSIEDLLTSGQAGQDKPKPDAKPGLDVLVENLRLVDGQLNFEDRQKKILHSLHDIDLELPLFFRQGAAEGEVRLPKLAATLNQTPFKLKLTAKPFQEAPEFDFELELSNLSFTDYAPYLGRPWPLEVKLNSLSIASALVFPKGYGAAEELQARAEVVLGGLRVSDPEARTVLGIYELKLEALEFDGPAKTMNLGALKLDSPRLGLTREKDGSINLRNLLMEIAGAKSAQEPATRAETQPADAAKPAQAVAEADKEQPSGQTPQPALSLNLERFELKEGEIDFLDKSLAAPFAAKLRDITIEGGGLGNLPGKPGQIKLAAKTDQGEELSFKASFDPGGKSEGEFGLSHLKLPRYLAYAPLKTRFVLEDGKLSLNGSYDFSLSQGKPQFNLGKLGISLESLRAKLSGEDKDFLSAARISAEQIAVNPAKRQLDVSSLKAQGLNLNLSRQKDGKLNLSNLDKPQAPAKSETLAAPAEAPVAVKPEAQTAQAQPAWNLNLGELGCEGCAVGFTDNALAAPRQTTLGNLNFSAKGLTLGGKPFNLSLQGQLNQAKLKLAGELGLTPLGGKINLELENLGLADFSDYLPPEVKASLKEGKLSTQGDISLADVSGKGLRLAFKGKAGLAGLKLAGADKESALLELKSLKLEGIDFSNPPLALKLAKVEVDGATSVFSLDKSGKSNLQALLPPDDAKPQAKPSGQPEPAFAPTIDKLVITHSQLNFSDYSVSPNYHLGVGNIEASLSNLAPGRPAELSLKALLRGQSPLGVQGKIAPFGKELGLDLKLTGENIDLSELSPYSLKYLGHPILKGKSLFRFDYRIESANLTAENYIFLSNLELGKKQVEKPLIDAPVETAVSLMQDSKGDIELSVPVSGKLDKLQLNLGKVISTALGNVFSKVVLAPFAFFKLSFGQGKSGLIAFAPGSTELGDPGRKNLDELSKLLSSRPNMSVEVRGLAAPSESEAVKRYALKARVAELKLKESPQGGDGLSDADYRKYLKKLYEQTLKQSGGSGAARQTPEEMENYVLGKLELDGHDYDVFATRRAESVMNYLTQTAKIDPKKVFLVAGVKAKSEPGKPESKPQDVKPGVEVRFK